jgi:hypothetical protein
MMMLRLRLLATVRSSQPGGCLIDLHRHFVHLKVTIPLLLIAKAEVQADDLGISLRKRDLHVLHSPRQLLDLVAQVLPLRGIDSWDLPRVAIFALLLLLLVLLDDLFYNMRDALLLIIGWVVGSFGSLCLKGESRFCLFDGLLYYIIKGSSVLRPDPVLPYGLIDKSFFVGLSPKCRPGSQDLNRGPVPLPVSASRGRRLHLQMCAALTRLIRLEILVLLVAAICLFLVR